MRSRLLTLTGLAAVAAIALAWSAFAAEGENQGQGNGKGPPEVGDARPARPDRVARHSSSRGTSMARRAARRPLHAPAAPVLPADRPAPSAES